MKTRVSFPYYLTPASNNEALKKRLGEELQVIRGKKSLRTIAEPAGVTADQIEAFENGEFRICLGTLRNLIHRGYGVDFTTLLERCYKEPLFDQKTVKDRPFKRDWYYRICLERFEGAEATAFLTGGDPNNFMWAVPIRRLRRQSLVTELLELAPARARKQLGVTPDNSHPGVEIITVIHGTIEVQFPPSDKKPRLRAGNSIHFHGEVTHFVKNCEKNTPALLSIVRLPGVRGK